MPGQYDHIVQQFLEEENGAIVCLTEDAVFSRALRNTISRIIGFKGETLFPFVRPGPAMEKCRELSGEDTPLLVFIERMLDERPNTDTILRLTREFPKARVIVLTWEATQETVAYFFELGVRRVLVKPVSADRVIEEMALALDPPSELKKLTDRCRRLLARGDFDEALEVTDRILLLTPDSARGLTMRGDALMGIEETDKGVQSYMAAHEAKPIYMEPLIKLAAAFSAMEDERALSYMQQLDEISPLNPERKIDIAEQHLLRGRTEEAEAYLDRSVEVAEREHLSMVGDLTERIVDAVAAQAPDLAVKYLNRVIDTKRVLGRDDLVHFNRLGIILRGEGKWREAVEVYEKALSIAKDDPAVHYNMGLAYWEGNERMTALKCFERAMDLDPQFYAGSIGAALNIGSLYLDLRQFADAEPFFLHVLDLDPENATAQKRLQDARDRVAPVLERQSRDREKDSDSAGTYDVDAMSGNSGGFAKQEKKSGGKVFNVDESSGGNSPKKKKKKGGKGLRLEF